MAIDEKEDTNMSDAKKCDRCGGFYMMRSENDIRPSLEGYRIFGVRYISGANQNIDKYDLCPKCAVKVWECISKYDESIEDQETNRKHEIDKMKKVLNEKFGVTIYADNETGYNKSIDLRSHKHRLVSFEVVNKCISNIGRLKEMYGISMRSRNITITYWPNFDVYLMTALVSINNVEHQIVKGDVDHETLATELLRFFEHIDMVYGDDAKEESENGDTQDNL